MIEGIVMIKTNLLPNGKVSKNEYTGERKEWMKSNSSKNEERRKKNKKQCKGKKVYAHKVSTGTKPTGNKPPKPISKP